MTLHLAFVRRSEPELGRDAHVLSKRCERFAHGLLVDVWATYFRDVEERDATGDCRADERDHPPRDGRSRRVNEGRYRCGIDRSSRVGRHRLPRWGSLDAREQTFRDHPFGQCRLLRCHAADRDPALPSSASCLVDGPHAGYVGVMVPPHSPVND